MNTTSTPRFGSQRAARLRANDLIALAAQFAGISQTYGAVCGRTFRARVAADHATRDRH